MASDNEACCESDPNFAVICGFLEKFGVTCGLSNIDFLDLQDMLENSQEVPQELVDLHVKLLRKARKSVSSERWERAIIKLCHGFCSQDAWEIERFGYKKARLSSKLRILKELLEMQFDYNAKFKNEINKLSAEELRTQPLGRDRLGHIYWFQSDNSCQIRVYKEDPDEETWSLVAKDREGLVGLINQLSDGNEAVVNEDSNSLESEKPVVDTGQTDSNSNSNSSKLDQTSTDVTSAEETSTEEINTKEEMEDKKPQSNDESVVENTVEIIKPTKIRLRGKKAIISEDSYKASEPEQLVQKNENYIPETENSVQETENSVSEPDNNVTEPETENNGSTVEHEEHTMENSSCDQDGEDNAALPTTLPSKSGISIRIKPISELIVQSSVEINKKVEITGVKEKYIRSDSTSSSSVHHRKAVDSAGFDVHTNYLKRPIDEEEDVEEPSYLKRPRLDRPTLLGNKKKKPYSDDDEIEDEELSDEIVEPLMLVKGEGSGQDNEGCNSQRETRNTEEEVSPIVGETIEESVVYFVGQGSGYECETGNDNSIDKKDASQEKNATKSKTDTNSKMESSKYELQPPSQESENTTQINDSIKPSEPSSSRSSKVTGKSEFKLGTVIDVRTNNLTSCVRSLTKKSRWDIGKPGEVVHESQVDNTVKVATSDTCDDICITEKNVCHNPKEGVENDTQMCNSSDTLVSSIESNKKQDLVGSEADDIVPPNIEEKVATLVSNSSKPLLSAVDMQELQTVESDAERMEILEDPDSCNIKASDNSAEDTPKKAQFFFGPGCLQVKPTISPLKDNISLELNETCPLKTETSNQSELEKISDVCSISETNSSKSDTNLKNDNVVDVSSKSEETEESIDPVEKQISEIFGTPADFSELNTSTGNAVCETQIESIELERILVSDASSMKMPENKMDEKISEEKKYPEMSSDTETDNSSKFLGKTECPAMSNVMEIDNSSKSSLTSFKIEGKSKTTEMLEKCEDVKLSKVCNTKLVALQQPDNEALTSKGDVLVSKNESSQVITEISKAEDLTKNSETCAEGCTSPRISQVSDTFKSTNESVSDKEDSVRHDSTSIGKPSEIKVAEVLNSGDTDKSDNVDKTSTSLPNSVVPANHRVPKSSISVSEKETEKLRTLSCSDKQSVEENINKLQEVPVFNKPFTSASSISVETEKPEEAACLPVGKNQVRNKPASIIQDKPKSKLESVLEKINQVKFIQKTDSIGVNIKTKENLLNTELKLQNVTSRNVSIEKPFDSDKLDSKIVESCTIKAQNYSEAAVTTNKSGSDLSDVSQGNKHSDDTNVNISVSNDVTTNSSTQIVDKNSDISEPVTEETSSSNAEVPDIALNNVNEVVECKSEDDIKPNSTTRNVTEEKVLTEVKKHVQKELSSNIITDQSEVKLKMMEEISGKVQTSSSSNETIDTVADKAADDVQIDRKIKNAEMQPPNNVIKSSARIKKVTKSKTVSQRPLKEPELIDSKESVPSDDETSLDKEVQEAIAIRESIRNRIFSSIDKSLNNSRCSYSKKSDTGMVPAKGSKRIQDASSATVSIANSSATRDLVSLNKSGGDGISLTEILSTSMKVPETSTSTSKELSTDVTFSSQKLLPATDNLTVLDTDKHATNKKVSEISKHDGTTKSIKVPAVKQSSSDAQMLVPDNKIKTRSAAAKNLSKSNKQLREKTTPKEEVKKKSVVRAIVKNLSEDKEAVTSSVKEVKTVATLAVREDIKLLKSKKDKDDSVVPSEMNKIFTEIEGTAEKFPLNVKTSANESCSKDSHSKDTEEVSAVEKVVTRRITRRTRSNTMDKVPDIAEANKDVTNKSSASSGLEEVAVRSSSSQVHKKTEHPKLNNTTEEKAVENTNVGKSGNKKEIVSEIRTRGKGRRKSQNLEEADVKSKESKVKGKQKNKLPPEEKGQAKLSENKNLTRTTRRGSKDVEVLTTNRELRERKVPEKNEEKKAKSKGNPRGKSVNQSVNKVDSNKTVGKQKVKDSNDNSSAANENRSMTRTRASAIKAASKSENIEQIAKSENIEQIAKSENIEQIAKFEHKDHVNKNADQVNKPENVHQISKSENVDEASKPENVDQASKPENVDQASKPENVDQVSKPENVDQASKPKNVDEASKPENVDEASKPESVDEASKPVNVDEASKPENVNQVNKCENPDTVENVSETPNVDLEDIEEQIVRTEIRPSKKLKLSGVVEVTVVDEIQHITVTHVAEKGKASEKVNDEENIEDKKVDKGEEASNQSDVSPKIDNIEKNIVDEDTEVRFTKDQEGIKIDQQKQEQDTSKSPKNTEKSEEFTNTESTEELKPVDEPKCVQKKVSLLTCTDINQLKETTDMSVEPVQDSNKDELKTSDVPDSDGSYDIADNGDSCGGGDDDDDVEIVPENDPLACSDEEPKNSGSTMTLATFKLDIDDESLPRPSVRITRKRAALQSVDALRETRGQGIKVETDNVYNKRPKLKRKRSVDRNFRRSIEEKKAKEISSSEEDVTKTQSALKEDGAKKSKTIVKRRVSTRSTRGTESPGPSSDAPSEASRTDASNTPPVVKQRKPRQIKKTLLGLEISPETENLIKQNLLGGTVRQSRRIAQLKIKEEAERRKLEEVTLQELKEEQRKRKGKKDEDKDYKLEKRKRNKNLPTEDETTGDAESDEKKKRKRKRKHRDPRKHFDALNPWKSSSGSSSSEVEEEEEEEPEEDDHPLVFKSDHEFSPESDLEEGGEVQPLKRARTARKESDAEEEVDDCACQKCGQKDHPEWILLCDSCDSGWHCSCLRPALLVIPEGDWFCPPCQHVTLVKNLEVQLVEYDKRVNKKLMETRRKERLAYVGISLDNVLPSKEPDEHRKNQHYQDHRGDGGQGYQNDSDESGSDESGSDSDSSSGSDSDSEPIYQLRERRQAHSYRFNDYDELINSAIQEELDAVKGAGNQGRGKDISTIVNAEKEEEAQRLQSETNGTDVDAVPTDLSVAGAETTAVESLPPVVPVDYDRKPENDSDDESIKPVRKIIGKKKHRKLNSLDVSSGDDAESDEDFKGSSSSDSEDEDFDDEEYAGSESSDFDSRRGKRRKDFGPVRRSTRARISRYDKDFINDDDSESEADGPRRKKTRPLWNESESEESDRSWGRRKRKSGRSKRKQSTKPKKSKKKKKRRTGDDSDPEVYRKRPNIKFGGLNDDEEVGRRTRGKKINYLEALGTDSEEEIRRKPPRIEESEEEYMIHEDEDFQHQLENDKDSDESGVENVLQDLPLPQARPKPRGRGKSGLKIPRKPKDQPSIDLFPPIIPEISQLPNTEPVAPAVPSEMQQTLMSQPLMMQPSIMQDQDLQDIEDEPNPIEQINKNVEQMNEQEMEKMMEEEDYANRQLQLVALQIEKEKKRKEREAKRMEKLGEKEQKIPKKRGRKPKNPMAAGPADIMSPFGESPSMLMNSMTNNAELSEPPGVSLPMFSEIAPVLNADGTPKKRRGRDSPMLGSKLGIATPPQPFGQSQPTPSVITRMLQSQPGQGSFPGGAPKYYGGPPPGDPQLGPQTASGPYHPGTSGPRGPMPGAYQQPPPGMSHYPVVRSGPAPPHRLHSPGPPGLPPPMYHRSMDPSPSGGGTINTSNRDRHSPAVVPPATSSPLSKGDPTPPPPPYTRPQVGHFPPVTGSGASSLAPTGQRHVSMIPPHLQHRASNMSPYHPGVPPNYYGSYPPPPPLTSDEGQPPPVYPSSAYPEPYAAEGGTPIQPAENSGVKPFDEDTGGEFVGLVSYFSSQREDDLET